MSERPILFNGDMVRAILSGEKTQTRRMVKLKDIRRNPDNDPWYKKCLWSWRIKKGGLWTDRTFESLLEQCPFGQVGDRLWVRESATVVERMGAFRKATIRYEADGTVATVEYPARLVPIPCVGRKLANGAYREASRITLDIVSVRVERLQDITDAEARAEGFKDVGAFADCWNSIYKNWHENLWVWVVEFKHVEAM